jgi:lupus La protein
MSETSLADKIRQQVEFYFSNSNFPRDKFLRSQAALNEEGFVPLSVIATFSKLKMLSTDLVEISNALKNSETLVLNEDATKVRRKYPLPDSDDWNVRTIYVKGFLPETTIEDIRNVLLPYGTILSVRIRKNMKKQQKDSAFVEFSSESEAKAAIASKVQYNGKELIMIMRDDYEEKKKNESEMIENDQENKETKRNQKPFEGSVLHITNIGENVFWKDIKELFEKYNVQIAFVDFTNKDTEAYLRFKGESDAKTASDSFQIDPKELGGKSPVLSVLEGEALNRYLDKIKKHKFGRGKELRKKRKTQRF